VNALSPRLDVHLHLPTATIIKVLLAALVATAVVRLWPEFVFLLLSLLLAVALNPLVARAEAKGLSRGHAITLLAFVMAVAAVFLVAVVLTSLAEQLARLAHDFPALREGVLHRLRGNHPMLKRILGEIFALPESPELAAQLKRPLSLGQSAVMGAAGIFFTLVLTLYLLIDGKRLYAWLLAYVPRKHRDRMAETVDEVSEVVYAYVRGQVITSIAFALFAALVLHLFRVPAAWPLAIFAGLCDVIPVVGIVIATLPAAFLALTVSPATAALVLALYIAYHVVESYLVVPRVYGQRLRLSTLAVLLALVAGNTLQGLVGAVLVLPLVAAYPIIERIWLARFLSAEVIKDHRALASAAETGSEHAVDTVLQGEKHPWEAGGTTEVSAPNASVSVLSPPPPAADRK
jgi:predicted PurR-regulated permease PerM